MFEKSLRELNEAMGLRAIVGVVRGIIVLSIVEKLICLKLWGILEWRDGYDVLDQGGSSAPSTSGLPRFSLMTATSTAIVAIEVSILYEEDKTAKMGRLLEERSSLTFLSSTRR